MQAKEVSQLLAQRAEEVSRYLLPEGKREGHEWCVGSISGESGKSLKIHLDGLKAGVWCDFATGDFGDLLDLWALTRSITISVALVQACDYLNIQKPHFVGHKPKQFKKPFKALPVLEEMSPVVKYLTEERCLTVETLKDFQIGQQGDDIVFPYLREGDTVFIKYISLKRPNGKKQVRVEANCEPSLFGWHLILPTARTITLCEGEIDAMTLHQVGIPALSVPFGAGSGKKHEWIEYEYDRLAIFDEIYLCMDNDKEGHIATKELAERLGAHRCRLVELPFKDPNQCLQEGLDDEFMQEFFKEAKNLDPQELKRVSNFISQLINEFYPPDGKVIGYESPWKKTDDKILFRPAELSIWGGINGHGKSQFLGQIMLGMMNQDAKICIASLELKAEKLLMRLTKQASGLALPSEIYIQEIAKTYENSLWLFDLVGNAKSERLLDVFKYARHRYGIDVFIIDSFMMLDIAEEDYKAQKLFIEKLCEFKNQHNCQIHLVVHPRKGADETSTPGKLDYKGTGAVSDLADNCFTVWRNKHKEAALQKQSQGNELTVKESESLTKPDSIWRCDKQRHGNWEGSFGFWFDSASFQYLPNETAKPKSYVKFSCLNG